MCVPFHQATRPAPNVRRFLSGTRRPGRPLPQSEKVSRAAALTFTTPFGAGTAAVVETSDTYGRVKVIDPAATPEVFDPITEGRTTVRRRGAPK